MEVIPPEPTDVPQEESLEKATQTTDTTEVPFDDPMLSAMAPEETEEKKDIQMEEPPKPEPDPDPKVKVKVKPSTFAAVKRRLSAGRISGHGNCHQDHPHPGVRHLNYNRELAPYSCNLCNQYVRGAVITICGHLFCWQCLWPNLQGRSFPKCPHCSKRLILHEDIIPFHGEGPLAGPNDSDVLAQPGSVPRPTGMYLSDDHVPVWFMLNDAKEEADRTHQWDPFSLLVLFPWEFPRVTVHLKVLKWLQLIIAILLCLLCCFVPLT